VGTPGGGAPWVGDPHTCAATLAGCRAPSPPTSRGSSARSTSATTRTSSRTPPKVPLSRDVLCSRMSLCRSISSMSTTVADPVDALSGPATGVARGEIAGAAGDRPASGRVGSRRRNDGHEQRSKNRYQNGELAPSATVPVGEGAVALGARKDAAALRARRRCRPGGRGRADRARRHRGRRRVRAPGSQPGVLDACPPPAVHETDRRSGARSPPRDRPWRRRPSLRARSLRVR